MNEFDVYISFAREDNRPLLESEKGWVAYFHEFLSQVLEKLLNRKPLILFLSNNENPSRELLERAKVLICIISPSFVKSSYCIEDIHFFVANPFKKIFKVIKHPVAINEEPEDVRRLPYYYFNKNSQEDIHFFSSDIFFNEDAERYFWLNIIDLAKEIAWELENQGRGDVPALSTANTVYLAETSSRYNIEKHHIRRELERQGCVILPSQPYPSNVKELEVFIKNNIENCNISIHLIGNSNSSNSTYRELMIQELEDKIAAEQSLLKYAQREFDRDKEEFTRYIWISPDLKKDDERQKSFFENYLRNGESLESAEIVQAPIEDFKFLVKKVVSLQPTQYCLNNTFEGAIYLMYDRIDFEEGERLAQDLKNIGFNILQPLFSEDLRSIRQHHMVQLVECDGVIILHNKVSEQWTKMKCLDLVKSPGFGRTKPLLTKMLYTTGSSEIAYDFYKTYDIHILDNSKDLLINFLKPFLQL